MKSKFNEPLFFQCERPNLFPTEFFRMFFSPPLMSHFILAPIPPNRARWRYDFDGLGTLETSAGTVDLDSPMAMSSTVGFPSFRDINKPFASAILCASRFGETIYPSYDWNISPQPLSLPGQLSSYGDSDVYFSPPPFHFFHAQDPCLPAPLKLSSPSEGMPEDPPRVAPKRF